MRAFCYTDDENDMNNSTTPQDSAVAKTLAATLGSIEMSEDMPSPPITKKQNDIPIIQTADSSADQSPEDSPSEFALSRSVI